MNHNENIKTLRSQTELDSYRDFTAAGLDIKSDGAGYELTMWDAIGRHKVHVSLHGNFYDLCQTAYTLI